MRIDKSLVSGAWRQPEIENTVLVEMQISYYFYIDLQLFDGWKNFLKQTNTTFISCLKVIISLNSSCWKGPFPQYITYTDAHIHIYTNKKNISQ